MKKAKLGKLPIRIDSAGNSVRSGCTYSLRYANGDNHHFKTVHVFYDEAGQFVCRDMAKTVANGFQLVRDQPADAIWDFVDGHKVLAEYRQNGKVRVR